MVSIFFIQMPIQGYLLPVSKIQVVNDNSFAQDSNSSIFVKQYFYRDSQDEQTFFYFGNTFI
jgi:hypothetical protein